MAYLSVADGVDLAISLYKNEGYGMRSFIVQDLPDMAYLLVANLERDLHRKRHPVFRDDYHVFIADYAIYVISHSAKNSTNYYEI